MPQYLPDARLTKILPAATLSLDLALDSATILPRTGQ
jgi:hypothetical protein